MKKISVCILLFLSIHTAYGQGNFDVGTKILGVGLGVGNSFGGTYSSQSPALSGFYEQGMWSVGGPGVISLGAYAAHKSFSYNYGIYRSKWNYTLIGARSAYHYNGINSSDWDVFGGLMLSYRVVSHSDNDPFIDYTYSDGIYLSAFVGARYYFSSNVAGFAELGSGIALLTLGAAFKL